MTCARQNRLMTTADMSPRCNGCGRTLAACDSERPGSDWLTETCHLRREAAALRGAVIHASLKIGDLLRAPTIDRAELGRLGGFLSDLLTPGRCA